MVFKQKLRKSQVGRAWKPRPEIVPEAGATRESNPNDIHVLGPIHLTLINGTECYWLTGTLRHNSYDDSH